jgi:histidine triad (HIT) family protein
VYQDDYVTAFIGAGWWKNNKGHVIIIPNKHYETIYALPSEYSQVMAEKAIKNIEKNGSLG